MSDVANTGADASLQYRACGRTHQPPETRSVGKRMAGLGFPTCNTAFCPLLDELDQGTRAQLEELSTASNWSGNQVLVSNSAGLWGSTLPYLCDTVETWERV